MKGHGTLVVGAGIAQKAESGYRRRKMLYLRMQVLKESWKCRVKITRPREEGVGGPKPYRASLIVAS